MIVEFSVQNFRSIKDLQTISFVATGLKSPSNFEEVDVNNIEVDEGLRLLKTLGLYGANASGKSNVVRALVYFLQAIKNEASSESNLSALSDPFLYQDDPVKTESYFQIVLFVRKKKYRYGITVRRNDKLKINTDDKYSKEVIVSEWLYGTKEKNLVEFFTRKGLDVEKDKLPNFEKIPPIPYEHTLFLTHSAAFDSDGDSAAIRNYIIGWTLSNFNGGLERFRWNTLRLLEEDNKKKDFLELLSSFNLKYDDIVLDRDESKPPPAVLLQDKIYLIKSYLNNDNNSSEVKLN